MRDWSREVGHGFGQLVDWAWAIDDAKNTAIFNNAFGCDGIGAVFLLVCGRDAGMEDRTEIKRLFWRANNVMLQGKHATFLTYDGLFEMLQANIEALKSYRPSEPDAGT